MSLSLLSVSADLSKIRIPTLRRGAIVRPRLLAALTRGRASRLTLVSAPAGYGKTTLLSQWCLKEEKAAAWVTLDENDNDPLTCLSSLVASLHALDPLLAQSSHSVSRTLKASSALGRTSGDELNLITAALFKDIAAFSEPFVLIMDDYHLIRNFVIHQAVEMLIMNCPENMQIVISSRTDPPFGLHILRARNQLTELHEPEMRFNLGEAFLFFNRTMGLDLDEQAAGKLEARTEGWIAGLKLAALSLQGTRDPRPFIECFAGDNQQVETYLVEQVLIRQPEAIQAFLLRTSVLENLCGHLCDALLADIPMPASSQAILEKIEADNLFLIPLDDKRKWFRYHQLFSDALRYRLEQSDPDLLNEMHRRASHWYDRQGQGAEAIEHALSIPDYALAARLAEQYGIRMVASSRVSAYVNWVHKIPFGFIAKRVFLLTCLGFAYVIGYDVEQCEICVAEAERQLPGYEPLYLEFEKRYVSKEEVQGNIATIRAYIARNLGNLQDVNTYAERALAYLPPNQFSVISGVAFVQGLNYLYLGQADKSVCRFQEAYEKGFASKENHYVTIGALGFLGHDLEARGHLTRAQTAYQKCITLSADPEGLYAPMPVCGVGYRGLAQIDFQRGDTVGAEANLIKAADYYVEGRNYERLCWTYLLHARIANALGDETRTRAYLEKALSAKQTFFARLGHDRQNGIDSMLWLPCEGELHLELGDPETVESLLKSAGIHPSKLTSAEIQSKSSWLWLENYLLLLRLNVFRKQWKKADQLAEWLRKSAGANRYFGIETRAVVFQAVARFMVKKKTEALALLDGALKAAEPEGYIQPFVAAGSDMIPLLQTAIAKGRRSAFAGKVLLAFPEKAHPRNSASVAASGLPETADPQPLTHSEVRILQLLADGLSAKEIAQVLPLTVNTVRSYIKNIYQKTGSHSRVEAVRKAKAAGLFSRKNKN